MKIMDNIRARISRYFLKRRIKHKCDESRSFLEYAKMDVPEAEKQMAYTLGVEGFNEVVELLEVYNESA